MLDRWRRFSFLLATGLSLLAIILPPWNKNDGMDEYGFIMAGSPSDNRAVADMSAIYGSQGRDMARSFIHNGIDITRLVVELVVIWGVYLSLRRTVLRPLDM